MYFSIYFGKYLVKINMPIFKHQGTSHAIQKLDDQTFTLVYFIEDNSYCVMKESLVQHDESMSKTFVYYIVKKKQRPFDCIILHKGTESQCDKRLEEILKGDKYALMLFESEPFYEVVKKTSLVKEKNGTAMAPFLLGKKHKLLKGQIIKEGSLEECKLSCESSNDFYKSFENNFAIQQLRQKIKYDKVFKKASVNMTFVDLDEVFKRSNLNKTYPEFTIEE